MIYTLCKTNEIPAEGTKIVEFFGRSVHIYKINDKPVAVANVCMHFGGPLECKDEQLVCPWHNAAFDMKTGQRIEGPAPSSAKLMFLSTRVDGDDFNYIWAE